MCVSRGHKRPHLQQRPNGATSVLYILQCCLLCLAVPSCLTNKGLGDCLFNDPHKLLVMQITIHANDLEMGPDGHATGDIVRCGLCEP